MLRTANGVYRYHRPVAYQILDDARVPVSCEYSLDKEGGVAFQVGAYDGRLDLVIDPVVEWATYLGGSGIDHIQAVGLDASGNAVFAGITNSPNFPGAVEREPGSLSFFVMKLNATGSAVLFTTFLGSRTNVSVLYGTEQVSSLAIDSDGGIYLAGIAYAPDFPTSANARHYGPSTGGFGAKLDGAGNLVYSTFLGYLQGRLTPDRVCVHNGTVLSRIDASGSRLLYSTFLGTTSVNGVIVLPGGDIVIAGASSLPGDWTAMAPHHAIRFSDVPRGGELSSTYIAGFSASLGRPLWTTEMQGLSSFGCCIPPPCLGPLWRHPRRSPAGGRWWRATRCRRTPPFR